MVPGKVPVQQRGILLPSPELFVLRVVKIQAGTYWPGEMGGLWVAEGFRCRKLCGRRRRQAGSAKAWKGVLVSGGSGSVQELSCCHSTSHAVSGSPTLPAWVKVPW